MCELFALSSDKRISCNKFLEEFFKHSEEHFHGWGIARFRDNTAIIEKEPVKALESTYLANRMSVDIEESVLIAHIRKASRGNHTYVNTHPFCLRDCTGRNWTLAHNGTIFDNDEVESMRTLQYGQSDSERVLFALVIRINEAYEAGMDINDDAVRCKLVSDLIKDITFENKVNILIYDGELLYVHSNHMNSLYRWVDGKKVMFITKPIESGVWEMLPINTVFAYKQGECVYIGEKHEHEFFRTEEKIMAEKNPDC